MLTLLALVISGCGSAILAPEISHQGRLLDDSGQPVADGNYDLTYQVYHSLSGGTAVYTATQTIAVQDGLFNASVGPATDLDPEYSRARRDQPLNAYACVEKERPPHSGLSFAPFCYNPSMTKPHTPVTETLNAHVTIRHFTPQPIPQAMLDSILDAARRSPTSSNMQTYSIIVVRDPKTRRALVPLTGNQKHLETCDVFLAFCADLHRLEMAVALHDLEMATSLENTLVATIDAALVGMSAQTAAESFGLGAVMIGAMRNHPIKAARLLGLPEGVYVVYGMCLGWPDETRRPPQKPRLPRELVIHEECYNTSDSRPLLRAHDHELAAHYTELGRNLDEAAWSGPIANRLQTPSRPHLRRELEALGFSFE